MTFVFFFDDFYQLLLIQVVRNLFKKGKKVFFIYKQRKKVTPFILI